MSKRTAFSQKCEQRHWRLRHDHEEIERQQKRVRKGQRKAATKHNSELPAEHEETAHEETAHEETE